jgi:hypothetical protein
VIHLKPSKGKIIVTGMACHLPIPGVVYQVLHYLLGLRRLGYETFYVEDSDRWVYDLEADDVTLDATRNVAVMAAMFDAHGFSENWAFRGNYEGGRCYGMDESHILRLYRDADALLNVTGQDIAEEQLVTPRRIYVESDPFATQVRLHNGDAEELARLSAHDTHFSFGENIGAADCGVPATQFCWLSTRQPVDIELWTPPAAFSTPRPVYTTVTSWVNHVPSILYNGESYHWQKDREFEKFLDLPHRSAAKFELATKVDETVGEKLCAHGWHHVPAAEVAQEIDDYRSYIWNSRAEFTVARDQYVRPRTGWFSDRSACYLASGRPVITQETGFSKFLPTGQGLFAFTTMDEILAAVDAIEADYAAHSEAAREIAVDYFAAEKVVGSLMERAGL